MNTTTMCRGIATFVAACTLIALAPAAPAAAAPRPLSKASRILLVRSGGITGAQETFLVDRWTIGGYRPLALASSYRFRWLRSSYMPKDPCCDRFQYRVTVTYRTGHRKTVTTMDGGNAPKILWDVIRLTERVGNRPKVGLPPA